MKRIIVLTIIALGLTCGCSTLIPKKVELGQDKVAKFPTQKWREQEIQRQAAQRAREKALESLLNAVKTNSETNVVLNASETAEITDALADVLGPPEKRSDETTVDLADRTRATVAKQDERVNDFKDDNDENAGKKIEGTGFLQVGYFAWVGGFLVLAFLGILALRVVSALASAANPAVGVGLGVAKLGARGAAKALGQVIKGGQNFKALVTGAKDINDEVTAKVLELFRQAQNKAQDEDVQDTIKKLTK